MKTLILRNTNQIIWALSTRLRPDQDVEFSEDGNILFDTTRLAEKLEVPSLPQDIIERITNKLREAPGAQSQLETLAIK